MEDIILIDKPTGITSFDVIRQLRRKLGIKKMGHAGTLDPAASGLMIIGINKGTKKLAEFLKLDKVYQAEVLVGLQTDSGDMEGKIVKEESVDNLDKEKVEEVLRGLLGKINLPVPIYSAIKRGGEALYKKARRGEDVKPPIKEMEVFSAKLNEISRQADKYLISVTLHVASGTYIRSLAEEIGKQLGYSATLQALRRTKIGKLTIEESEKL